LFASVGRTTDVVCPPRLPAEPPWFPVAATAPILRSDRSWGTVYIENDATELTSRAMLTTAAGTAMLILAAALATVLAHRLHRTVSGPIVQLAAAFRQVSSSDDYQLPDIPTPPDEVGALVSACRSMMAKLHAFNRDLSTSNEALRREVEERRRVEAEREEVLARERQANRLKDEFLATVSHELRTPLNSILGWAQILSMKPPNADTLARATASLLRNVQAQTRMIDDLIDISRILVGKLHLQMAAVDLRDVVEAAWEVASPGGRAKRLHMTLDVPVTPCLVRGDKDRLQQTVWNLLVNAVKFTPDGGSVSVQLRPRGSSFVLTVCDTGIGIAREFLPHVFERFRQADGSLSRGHGGLGIGLAITRELVELHGGTVDVESEGADRGAQFTITLPQSRERSTPTEEPPLIPMALLSGIRVLAVDDNLDALEIVSGALQPAGATVVTASSGAAGLRAWSEGAFDVLLCDLAMPESNGFAVLRRIRELDAQVGRATPVIAVTAQTSEDCVSRTIRAGFDRLVAKPYDFRALVQVVADVVGRG
jgi:signal transduction histidine kinase/CheY-like chemotaxis protein